MGVCLCVCLSVCLAAWSSVIFFYLLSIGRVGTTFVMTSSAILFLFLVTVVIHVQMCLSVCLSVCLAAWFSVIFFYLLSIGMVGTRTYYNTNTYDG